jgi:hypothetical protein
LLLVISIRNSQFWAIEAFPELPAARHDQHESSLHFGEGIMIIMKPRRNFGEGIMVIMKACCDFGEASRLS